MKFVAKGKIIGENTEGLTLISAFEKENKDSGKA
jgi:hypothetical protein